MVPTTHETASDDEADADLDGTLVRAVCHTCRILRGRDPRCGLGKSRLSELLIPAIRSRPVSTQQQPGSALL